MNAAAHNPRWLQAAGVGPNGRYHRMKEMTWGGGVRVGAVCGGFTLIELDPGRPYPRLNPDARKCKACLSTLEAGDMGYSNDYGVGGDVGDPKDTPRAGGLISKRSNIEARIERHRLEQERAERELARLESLPSEPEVEDSEPNVIWFTKTFQNGSREYTYAAVKCSDGLWYTSGPNTPKGYVWDRLVDWIFNGESAEVWHATAYDSLG